jgi:signal transduction histidine kinase
MRHILGNLLSNAVKYSSDGQPVKLEVKRVVNSLQPNGTTDTPAEPHLEFKVSDAGIGIPAADLGKLYQTFHRAANVGNRPGTGMGLAIVKQFVDLARGSIQIESQEGKGTTVRVHLPAGN